MHTSISGVADHLATSDAHAVRLAREAILDLGESPSRAVRFPAVSLPQADEDCDRIARRLRSDRPSTRPQSWTL